MITSLAYIGFTSPHAEAWRSFGPEVLGAELAPDGPDGAVRLRFDEAPWRVAVHPAGTNGLRYLGWDAGDSIEAAIGAVERAGFPVHRDDLGEERPVGEVAWFRDPCGFRHELATILPLSAPFVPARPMGGFVTGEQGLGHVVLIVPDLDAALAFYLDVLGFRLSDEIESFLSL